MVIGDSVGFTFFILPFEYQSVVQIPTVVEPVVRTLSGRSANRHPAHVTKDKPENKSAGKH